MQFKLNLFFASLLLYRINWIKLILTYKNKYISNIDLPRRKWTNFTPLALVCIVMYLIPLFTRDYNNLECLKTYVFLTLVSKQLHRSGVPLICLSSIAILVLLTKGTLSVQHSNWYIPVLFYQVHKEYIVLGMYYTLRLAVQLFTTKVQSLSINTQTPIALTYWWHTIGCLFLSEI